MLRGFVAAALILAVAVPCDAGLVINEFMAVNDSTLADEDGTFSDWLEIHNPGPGSVDLAGWFLTDDALDLTKWQFPSTTLTAGQYAIVFASAKNRAVAGQQLHTNFKLSGDGEYVGLTQLDGTTVEHEYAPAFPLQEGDVSYGLASDLLTERCFNDPTPAAANDEATGCGKVAALEFSSPHGFYSAPLFVSLSTATAGAQIYYTLDGSEPEATSAIPYTAPISW